MSIRNGTISPELEARYLEPYTYTLKHWGNQIAPKLIEPFNYWFKLPQEKLELVREVMVMLYNACVLLDDIQDNSAFRAGRPVAHHVYGIPLTVNAATAVYFLAIEKLLNAFPADAPSAGIRVLTQQWTHLHRGQGAEIYLREAFLCPSEEEYLELATIKSGCFIGMIIDLMQLFSEDKRDFTALYRVMSMYLQIANDYENFKEKDPKEFKGYAEDLTEGKFSFPVIHAIHNSPDDKSFSNIFKKRPESVQMKMFAIRRMEELGSFAYTHKVMNEYLEKALAEVDKLGGNPLLKRYLEYTKKYTEE